MVKTNPQLAIKAPLPADKIRDRNRLRDQLHKESANVYKQTQAVIRELDQIEDLLK